MIIFHLFCLLERYLSRLLILEDLLLENSLILCMKKLRKILSPVYILVSFIIMERTYVLASHVIKSTDRREELALKLSASETVITIIGGGNSGHVCASLIHGNTKGAVKVQLFTRYPERWSRSPTVKFPDNSKQEGLISFISSDPREVLPQSDIVLWTGPVNATKAVFESIRPYIDPRKTVVGTIFAQGLTHILAYRIFGSDMRFFALRNIPWLCRTVKVGFECEIVGAKSSIEAAVVNISEEYVKTVLEPLFRVRSVNEPVINVISDFVPIVFNPANQLIHPAVYYALFAKWRKGKVLSGEEEPNEWLYRDMSELAGNILQAIDDEMQNVKSAYFEATGFTSCFSVLPLKDHLLLQYGDQIKDKSTMAKIVGTNAAYSMAKTPLIRSAIGVVPNPKHRVVLDDIGWGLCVLVSIADRLEVPVHMMKMLIYWHQDMMGKEFLINGRLAGKDCSDLVLLSPSDPLDLVARVASASRDVLADADDQAEENRIGNP